MTPMWIKLQVNVRHHSPEIGMEWLYRCMKEPKRLFKRYFVDDMQFFYYFGKQLLGIYKDPFRKK
jgi:hypothetical protein